MKLFAKLVIAVLFMAMLLPFTILKGPDGEPLMSFSDIDLSDFSLPSLPKMPNASNITSSNDSLGGKDIFYQWYDADGNIQFSTEPPAEGIEYTVKGFDPNTNLIQAIKTTEPEPAPVEDSPTEQKTDEIGNIYSKESIEKLFEDAKDIEKVLKQRFQDQESAINQ